MVSDGISVRRLLKARRSVVFDAWTRPALMARWFHPGLDWTTQVRVDLRVGGAYELRMRDPDGGEHLQFGEYREITPVSRLVFTWNCPDLQVVESVVTVDLLERGERSTELVITHELPPDPKIRRGHEEGWTGCLASLDHLLNEGGGE
jgi:uncharacterized protein YndB with AHSA1/START domain